MPNLPADLPEDWTSNQKISPNGTEVGLSEQHGYNYLMKQVNDTQEEVNNIGTTIEAALEDVALESSVQEVITTIGDTGDTGGSTVAGTVMAKLNNLIDQDDVQSNKLDTVLTILGSGVAEYTSPGNYQLEIPAGITKIKVTACGGGGGGGDENSSRSGCGGGGGGAAAIVNQEYTLEGTAATQLNITVGSGGSRNKNGGATVIGNLVTLAGGKAGSGDSGSNVQASGGAAGGTGGGAGGYGKAGEGISVTSQAGTNGVSGTGGSGRTANSDGNNAAGGGGGGSLGNGGAGAYIVGDRSGIGDAVKGSRGGGGGGGAFAYISSGWGNIQKLAASGGSGYVKIEWGL